MSSDVLFWHLTTGSTYTLLAVPRLGNCSERYGFLDPPLAPGLPGLALVSMQAALSSAITVTLVDATLGLVSLAKSTSTLAWEQDAHGLGWNMIWPDSSVSDAQKVFQLTFLSGNPASATSPPYEAPVPWPYAPYSDVNVVLLPYLPLPGDPSAPSAPVESYVSLQTLAGAYAVPGQIIMSNLSNLHAAALVAAQPFSTTAFLPVDWVFCTQYPPTAADGCCCGSARRCRC